MENKNLYKFILGLGDNSMILGHRLSELCGHGPSLETDIALTNISLDLYGQVRSLLQYAAKIKGGEATEDSVAFGRYEREYYNSILVEQKNHDFAHVIIRQYLFDQFHLLQLNQLENSSDETLSAIAVKTIKETKYHLRFSKEWMKRLAGGTELSLQKTQTALDHLYSFSFELFNDTKSEVSIAEQNICERPSRLKEHYYDLINSELKDAGLTIPEIPPRQVKGKQGIHSEEMGYIISELQFMQKTYPNMAW